MYMWVGASLILVNENLEAEKGVQKGGLSFDREHRSLGLDELKAAANPEGTNYKSHCIPAIFPPWSGFFFLSGSLFPAVSHYTSRCPMKSGGLYQL